MRAGSWSRDTPSGEGSALSLGTVTARSSAPETVSTATALMEVVPVSRPMSVDIAIPPYRSICQ